MKRVDVVIIGSGAAGLAAAAAAAGQGLSIAVLTKGQTGRSGATVTVSGDVSVDGRTCRRLLGLDGSEDDSEDAFFEDTVKAGKFLNDQSLATAMVEEVGREVKELIDLGLKVTGPLLAPGHRFPRGVWGSGMQMLQIMTRRAVERGVKFRDEFYATDVLATEDGVAGIAGVDLRTGQAAAIEAKAVVLATGGGMMVYPFQTAPEELVGDGYRMALEAGARLIDMEMVQFLPCCFVDPPIWRGIQFAWLLGPQSGVRAWLLNKYGERFMARWDPERMEMSTRDAIAIACAKEVLEGRGGPKGGVFLSWAHLPTDILDYLVEWYGKPHLRKNWHWEGFDFAPLVEEIRKGKAVEVASASHFFMGGIAIDGDGATDAPGLFACGEVAGGVHGANRLSGNACSQFLVQGRRAGAAAAAFARRNGFRGGADKAFVSVRADIEAPLARSNGLPPHEFGRLVQDVANRGVGVVRTKKGIGEALEKARELRRDVLPTVACKGGDRVYNKEWVEALEARSLATTLEAIAISALAREESRGAHYRDDFPKENSNAPIANGMLFLDREELRHLPRPVKPTRLQPAAA